MRWIKVMTPEEFEDRMSKCLEECIDEAHIQADDLMCEVLRQLGYGDGIDIFEGMDKWYA